MKNGSPDFGGKTAQCAVPGALRAAEDGGLNKFPI